MSDPIGTVESRLHSDLPTRGKPTPNGRVILTPASAIASKRPRWAWQGRIPLDAVSLLVGDPGLGKSTITTELAARLSRGQLEGDLRDQPVDVLIATAEDSWETTVKPRLQAAGADLDRVHRIEIPRDGVPGDISLPGDVAAVEEGMGEIDARVLIIDPLVAHLPADVNSWRDQDVRRVLAPLRRLAEALHSTVVAILHMNKRETTELLTRVGGSVGMPAAARSVLAVAPDPDDREGPVRILAHAKCNVGPKAQALRFRIEGREVAGNGQSIPTSGVAWLGEAEGLRESDLFAREDTSERSARRQATDFLREELAEGPVLAADVRREARANDISQRTLERAKAALGVVSKKEGGTYGGDRRWRWSLPEDRLYQDVGVLQAKTGSNPQVNSEDGQLWVDGDLQELPDEEPPLEEDLPSVDEESTPEPVAARPPDPIGAQEPLPALSAAARRVVQEQRALGRDDSAIAVYLETTYSMQIDLDGHPEDFLRPEGYDRWTPAILRWALGEGPKP
jgi:hypothetical protein